MLSVMKFIDNLSTSEIVFQTLLLLKGHCVAALLRRPDRHCLSKVGVGINANLRVVCLLFVTENQVYLSGIRQGWHDPQRQHQ